MARMLWRKVLLGRVGAGVEGEDGGEEGPGSGGGEDVAAGERPAGAGDAAGAGGAGWGDDIFEQPFDGRSGDHHDGDGARRRERAAASRARGATR